MAENARFASSWLLCCLVEEKRWLAHRWLLHASRVKTQKGNGKRQEEKEKVK
jgi:hypothetical protein